MAWPPPLISRPCRTASRTARPRSTPAIERPEPVPMPPGSSAIAKAGRPNFSLSLPATMPTTPGCQPSAAVTTTAPLSSTPSAAMASASACASVASSIACRSRLRWSSSAARRAHSVGSSDSNRSTPSVARPIERDHGHEHQADGGEMAELGKIVEPVRVDYGDRLRERLVGEVMVDDDHVEAELLGLRQRLVAGGAAVDGDQERDTAAGKRA